MAKNLQSLTVAIVTHEATTGPAHDVRDFLVGHKSTVFFIAHPLLFIPANRDKSSYQETYQNGMLVERRPAYHWSGPEFFLYGKDLLYTLWWLVAKRTKYDVYIGSGNLNVLVGLLLRKLGLAHQVVFYCIDYVPQRFANPVVNSIYHWIDRIAAEYADVTWNLSPRMADGRNKRWSKQFLHQQTVPIGVHFERIGRQPFERINRTEIIYMGTLLEKQGVQLVIQALPAIAKAIADVHFTVIGSGPYEPQLKSLVSKLGMEKRVRFTGYVKDHQDVEKMMARGAIAVAMYDKETDQFSYYADPGKVKNYLAAGLPVVITDVPYIAEQISQKKCGVVIAYDKQQLADAIIALLRDRKELEQYRQNAINFAKEFDWDILLSQAFTKLFV